MLVRFSRGGGHIERGAYTLPTTTTVPPWDRKVCTPGNETGERAREREGRDRDMAGITAMKLTADWGSMVLMCQPSTTLQREFPQLSRLDRFAVYPCRKHNLKYVKDFPHRCMEWFGSSLQINIPTIHARRREERLMRVGCHYVHPLSRQGLLCNAVSRSYFGSALHFTSLRLL